MLAQLARRQFTYATRPYCVLGVASYIQVQYKWCDAPAACALACALTPAALATSHTSGIAPSIIRRSASPIPTSRTRAERQLPQAHPSTVNGVRQARPRPPPLLRQCTSNAVVLSRYSMPHTPRCPRSAAFRGRPQIEGPAGERLAGSGHAHNRPRTQSASSRTVRTYEQAQVDTMLTALSAPGRRA